MAATLKSVLAVTGLILAVAGTSGRVVGLVIRPEFVDVRPSMAETNGHTTVNAMDALVEEAVYVGERVDLTVRLAQGDSILVARRALPGHALPQPGDRVVIAVPPTELSLVPLLEESGL